MLLALTVILSLLALGILLFGGFLAGEVDDAFSVKLPEAEAAYNKAVSFTDDIDQSRFYLTEALGLVNEALALRNDDLEALTLKKKIQAALAHLDRIIPLPEPALILDLRDLEEDASPIEHLILGDTPYFLSQAGHNVYRLDLDNNKVELALDAEAAPAELNWPARLLWMPSGEVGRPDGALLLLSEGRRLWKYLPGEGWQQLVLRDADEWQSLQDVDGFLAKLYVLDPSADQVWRYVATDTGYDSNRQGVLGAERIGQAQDMAIDGAVYLLDDSGNITKFRNGQAVEFTMSGLDRPVGSGAKLYTSPFNQWLYVSDPENQRIVAFDKEGSFQFQLIHSLLGDMNGFVIDEERGEIYLSTGSQLYFARLPTESEVQ
jgi:hypothetical protein